MITYLSALSLWFSYSQRQLISILSVKGHSIKVLCTVRDIYIILCTSSILKKNQICCLGVVFCFHLLDTTLCDKVCQWLAADRWFSPGTPFSSTDITEILLIVALNTKTLTPICIYKKKIELCNFIIFRNYVWMEV